MFIKIYSLKGGEALTTFEEILDGLEIVNKYANASICAEHDEIFAHYEGAMNSRDLAQMHKLNWSWEEDGWSHYV